MTSNPYDSADASSVPTPGGIANLASAASSASAEGNNPFATPAATWDERLFAKVESYSDLLSPILVKEARQAMKSQQFTLTFYLLIILGWIWTVAGSMLMLPGLYYAPWGSSLLVGYLLMLTVPLMLVVPFFAFRSLASETEDGTFELMSITTLSAWQIVWGKMATALLQSIVYFSALAPCIAFTYLLRGVNIVTIGVVLGYTILASMVLCSFALMLATVSTTRIWQSLLSVALVIALLLFGIAWCSLMTGLLTESGSLQLNDPDFWTFNGYIAAYTFSVSLLFLFIATGQISFASDNRSTAVRYMLAIIQLLICASMSHLAFASFDVPARMVGAGAFASSSADQVLEIASVLFIISAIFWAVVGPFLSLENATLSPRARRELPQSLLGRILLTWFNPGDGSGYVFTICSMASVIVFSTVSIFIFVAYNANSRVSFSAQSIQTYLESGAACLGYLMGYLGLMRVLAYLYYRRTGVKIPTVAAVLMQMMLYGLGILIPVMIESALSTWSDHDFSYTAIQLPNWFWTLIQIMEDKGEWNGYLVLVAGFGIFAINFARASRQAQDIRLPPPARVIEEELAAHAKGAHRNPWSV